MSAIKKPAIPDTPKPGSTPNERFQFDDAMKGTLEIVTGRRGSKVSKLEANASNADVIAKINELIERLM